MNSQQNQATRHVVAPLKRKHLRMQGWDFTSPGWYFLTICTKNMRSAFGTVLNGHMVLNEAGRIAEKFWREIPEHFPRAVVDAHVVMPDHVHGLLRLVDTPTAFRGGMEACREGIEDGRLLVLSPFDDAIDAPSARRAVWCNQYVLAHCERLVVGHLNPDGMLACILAEADPEKEVVRL